MLRSMHLPGTEIEQLDQDRAASCITHRATKMEDIISASGRYGYTTARTVDA